MISNSVTHLRSYTNSAITDIAANSAPISPVTPRDRRAERQRLRIKRRCLPMIPSSADVSAWSADIIALNDKCFMMFHNVLRVFRDVLLVVHDSGSRCFTMYHNVLQLFHNVLLCLTMFYDL